MVTEAYVVDQSTQIISVIDVESGVTLRQGYLKETPVAMALSPDNVFVAGYILRL